MLNGGNGRLFTSTEDLVRPGIFRGLIRPANDHQIHVTLHLLEDLRQSPGIAAFDFMNELQREADLVAIDLLAGGRAFVTVSMWVAV